ncbi:MAG TPA: FAD-dependent oxidoreductase, partial [Blastocatellia bacterium]|nr:FAD-dependent oxidoreductase [Blastocatellia bacterium]
MKDHGIITHTHNQSPANGNRHAIVLGGSMAGLLAARVLTDHFDRVTLIERDSFPDGPESRKGVPQGRHAHALLAKGREIVSRLFPDLMTDLVKGGATLVDIGAEARWYHFGGYKVRFQSGMVGPFMSRPFLEWHVRQRVLALKNLSHIDGCEVKGLIATEDCRRVTGVRVERRAGDDGPATLTADLIVDATGRGSQSPKWLETLGYGRPEENVVKMNAGYTSRIYRRSPEDLHGAKAVFVLPTPPEGKRMGALFPIEGNRWLVSIGG